MISNKNFKNTRVMLTSHSIQSRKIANRLESIPAENRTPEQKRFLANISDEERGIITIGDVREEKARAAKVEGDDPGAGDRAAEAEKIAEQKRKEAAAEKKPAKRAKSGAKKKG